jgi:putative transposase
MIDFLKQSENGVPAKELCRKHGFSVATFYKWHRRLGEMWNGDLRGATAEGS